MGAFKKGKFGQHTQGEHHVTMTAEIRVTQQDKEHQRLPANAQKLEERHRTDSSSQPPEGINPATLISDF